MKASEECSEECDRTAITCRDEVQEGVTTLVEREEDFAVSRPIPVPSPPLSLRTTVNRSSAGSSALSASACRSSATGAMSASGTIRLARETSFS